MQVSRQIPFPNWTHGRIDQLVSWSSLCSPPIWIVPSRHWPPVSRINIRSSSPYKWSIHRSCKYHVLNKYQGIAGLDVWNRPQMHQSSVKMHQNTFISPHKSRGSGGGELTAPPRVAPSGWAPFVRSSLIKHLQTLEGGGGGSRKSAPWAPKCLSTPLTLPCLNSVQNEKSNHHSWQHCHDALNKKPYWCSYRLQVTVVATLDRVPLAPKVSGCDPLLPS